MKGEILLTGGSAIVYCVHDRRKREVTDPEHVAFLGRAVNQIFDPTKHKLQNCPCCDNLFVAPDDTPRYCTVCQGSLVHPLGAPLPPPEGVI